MRRNIIPIKNNRTQPTSTSTQTIILNHINRMSQMMNAPSQRPPITANNMSNAPSLQLNSNPRINLTNSVDSDEDYFDDYIMNDT